MRFAFAVVRYTSQFAASQGIIAIKAGTVCALATSNKAIVMSWNSKCFAKLRRKLWFELAIWIMGGGNAVIVLVFWPGWWILLGAYWALWLLFH